MPRGRKPKHSVAPVPKKTEVRPSAERYGVDMLAGAEETYLELFKKCKEAEQRGDYSNSHCTTFRMIQQAVREFIPQHPHDRKYALSGELANIFRMKKGRYRICWIASSSLKRVCILYISESLRKEGDVNDPYRIFAQMVMSGRFNDVFQQFGVKMPHLKLRAPGKPH
jgi:mRNA-degrading endonuclease RelE of RelBE toxin-antitoxin system